MVRTIPTLLATILLASMFLVTVTPVSAQTENAWVSKAPMHVARGGLGVVEVNGKIYAIGGAISSGLYPPDILGGLVGTNEEYDIATDTWALKSPMPNPRDYFAIASYQNKIYCIGGAVGINIDKATHFSSYVQSGVNEVYDIASDRWQAMALMPVSGMHLQANVINGKIFVIGVGLTYVYDPATDSWTNKTAMPFSPPPGSGSYPSSTAIGNKIIVTGEFSTGTILSKQKILIYNTETDSWSEGSSGQTIVIDGAIGATSGVKSLQRVYVLGLAYGTFPVPSTNQVYNPKADIWTTATLLIEWILA